MHAENRARLVDLFKAGSTAIPANSVIVLQASDAKERDDTGAL